MGSSDPGERAVAAATLAVLEPTIESLRRGRSTLVGAEAAGGDERVLLARGAIEHALAAAEGNAGRLAAALEQTLNALELKPRWEPARFNLALIESDLGLCKTAQQHWQDFLVEFPESGWSAEARRRSRDLPCRADRSHVDPEPRDETYVLDALHRVLPEWRDASRRGQSRRAEQRLGALRAAAESLARRHGDGLLQSLMDELAEPSPDLLAAVDTYVVGRGYWQEEDFAAAKEHFAAAIHRLGDEESVLGRWIRLEEAGADLELGRFDLATSRLADLRQTDLYHASPAFRGHLDWKYGLAFGWAGRLGLSLESWSRAAKVFAAAGMRRDEASMRSMLGSAKGLLGLTDDAWNDRVGAFRVLRDLLPVFTYHTGLIGAATWAGEAGLHRAEATFLEEAALWGSELEDHAPSETLLAKAEALERRGAEDAARRAFSTVVEHVGGIAANAKARSHIEAAARLGVLANSSGSDAKARAAIRELVDYYAAVGPLPTRLRALRVEVEIARRAGILAGARESMSAALELIRTQYADLAADAARGPAYWESIQGFFDEAIDLEMATGDPMRAFDLLAAAQTLGEGRLDGAPFLRARAVSSKLGQRRTLLVLGLVKEQLVWWKADGGSITHGREAAGDLSLSIERLAREVVAGRATPEALSAMYDRLLAPALGQETGLGQLVIVPDRLLLKVPFAALRDRHGHYLIEHWSLSVQSSIDGAFRVSTREPVERGRWQVAVVGDPEFSQLALPLLPRLPGALAEAREIQRIYGPDRTAMVAGLEATARRVREVARGRQVLHVAAHALPGRRGWNDAIVLAADGESSGVTVANEMLAAGELAPRLVVLSACSSLGRYPTRGSGLVGLAGRLRETGVEAVVGTLWPLADDLLRQVLTDFHQSFAVGHSAADALRTAQLAAARRGDDADRCCAWAGLQLLGDVPADRSAPSLQQHSEGAQ